MTTPERVRVAVADDHPTFRSGLIAVLRSDPTLVVVGEAADGEAILHVGVEADVVLMDLAMPGVGGIEATRRLRAQSPKTRVVVVTMSAAETSVFAALRAGARGYLLKDAEPEEILAAVHAVAVGRAVFGPAIAERVLAYFAGPDAEHARPFPALTEREREVLEMMARGHDNASIAGALVISRKTVRNHVSNVLAKLQASDRTAAVIAARDAGLGEEPGYERPG